jgi:cell division protein FtsZ
MVMAKAVPNGQLIFGAVIDPTLGDEVRVTVIASGFEGFELLARAPQRVRRRGRGRAVRSGGRERDLRSLDVPGEDIDVPEFLR